MAKTVRRFLAMVEGLEERLTLSAVRPLTAVASSLIRPTVHTSSFSASSVNTLDVLNGFVKAYLSRVGEPNYDPAYDLNHNGQIGQVDGRLLLHSLPPVGPNIPLTLRVTLARQDKARGPLPTNSGGVTHSKEPTVLGHTTPGALIFTGTGTIDLKLHGPAVVADAQGNFSYKMNLTDGINQLDFQAVDSHGRQVLRAFPIYWLDFAAYHAAHPRRD